MLDINKIKKENLINTKENKNELLEYLKLNFPQTIKDGQVDLKAIAMLLGLNNKEIRGYELSFTGKALANALYDTPNTKELKFHKSLSKNFETTKNAIIKGDNLHALKLLKSAYYEKIKMIYIDPPYNTKNDKFIYNDDFVKEHKKLLIEVGLLEITEEGEEIGSEILNFFINAKGDRSHSTWLGFMLPRLKLARDLLREDGVIFISIDDNEQANLKILCDEIFGEENFISCFIWQKKSGGGQAKYFYEGHEYMLIYTKDKTNLNGLFKFKEKPEINNDLIRKVHGKYTNNESIKKILNLYPKDTIDHRNLMFEELDIFLKENMISEKKYNDIKSKIDSGEYFLQQYKDTKFHLICSYQDDNLSKMYSIFSGHWTSDGNEEIESIFNGKLVFENPKPTTLIKEIFFANTNQNDIILDFFAGSGTTAQAVMELNAEDNGNRKFILVQLDEKIDENKSKVAYDFCKNELGSENPVISDITIERVKRAGEKILKENRDKNLDLGFKVFSLVEKPELTKDELNTLNLKYHENLSPYEKALNLALLNGKTLDKDLKMILKDKLYECEDCFYIVNCDDEVLDFLRKTQNENVYINGYDDINLEDYLNLESFLKERLKMVY
ncbi:site-specific DNA-methyltransferase [Campylobacter jejuni]|uniref:site-specific DNA-methyltransferase (adenine-specific) n=4 Tax=Campylobacter jejuni TaxID=197 RepID=A0A3X9BZT8_CAMJU|nr:MULTISPECIES: site-specific DNA-methyltransferase [Campylobacter]EIK4445127.1 site-specific DNA-methyltransferase [Campylobacter coli]AON66487.1 Type III restriction-modification system methylation subunit [Campylobacter jejuni subsp. jejuni]ATD40888.1 DNA methyltransferase [Campylobacter jejuni]EAB5414715.1 site-specific DNA-methyltransferase [Campylobacter jejuni]EAC1654775.1 site-specific DNA-methyltransferase [Campylobacter jejuni]